MSLPRRLLFTLAAAMLALPCAASAQSDAEARVIVRFKPKADSVRAKALSARATRLEAREVAQTRATALGMRTGHALRAGLSLDERTHVVTARGMTAAQLAQRLAQDPEVEVAAVDGRRKIMALPNDPLFGGATPYAPSFIGRFPDVDGHLQDTYSRTIDQWYLKAPSGEVKSSINATAAWDLTTGADSVIVAVLDTGIRKDHPDLAGKIVGGYDLIGYGSPGAMSTAIANDNDGPDADASDPGDWVSQADVTSGALGSNCTSADVDNSSWHGTRVAGLIGAASNNGLGMAGVGWGLKILPVRVLGKCGGYDSDIMAGMKWAAGLDVPGLPLNPNKARVLNLSLGGDGGCGTTGTGALYREVIGKVTATGATVVVAAGNSAGQAVGLPGNCPGVISVAALRQVGSKVGFSSVGPEVSIAAPGGNCVNLAAGYPCLYSMFSTTNSGTRQPVDADNAYTNGAQSVGTSFSAPIVSGIVGLLASVRPQLSASEALPLLKLTARAFPTSGGSPGIASCRAPNGVEQLECYCTTATCGAGMVDAFEAVKAAQAMAGGTVAITPSPASGLAAGQTLTLTAAATGLASGRTVASTAWTLVDGGGAVAGFASGAGTATATLTPTAGGTVVVRADVTDNLGFVYSQSTSIAVTGNSGSTQTPGNNSGGGGGGGGGGAVSAGWLLALLLAAFSLRTPPMRQSLRRRP